MVVPFLVLLLAAVIAAVVARVVMGKKQAPAVLSDASRGVESPVAPPVKQNALPAPFGASEIAFDLPPAIHDPELSLDGLAPARAPLPQLSVPENLSAKSPSESPFLAAPVRPMVAEPARISAPPPPDTNEGVSELKRPVSAIPPTLGVPSLPSAPPRAVEPPRAPRPAPSDSDLSKQRLSSGTPRAPSHSLFGPAPSRPAPRGSDNDVNDVRRGSEHDLNGGMRPSPSQGFVAISRASSQRPTEPEAVHGPGAREASILDMPTPIAPAVSMRDPEATAKHQAVIPDAAFPSPYAKRDDETYGGGIPDEFVPKVCDPEADEVGEPGPPLFRVTASANTDRGRRRKRNEDSVRLLEDLSTYVVADGMGGHRGGAEASEMATETVEALFRTAESVPAIEEIPALSVRLARSFAKANSAIFARAQNDPTLAKMGTTMVVAQFAPLVGRVYVGHVGDSRCYRLRHGHLERLTQDHTMAEFGLTGPMSENLSRAVGIAPTVKVDIICGIPEVGDVYLLCSDGLTKMLEDALIHDTLDCFGATPEYAVDELVSLANARGGRDNVTVVVAFVSAVA